MDHQFENRDAAQLLREIAAAQQRNVRVVRIAAILVILLTAALQIPGESVGSYEFARDLCILLIINAAIKCP